MFGAFNTFGKLGSPAGSRSLLAQIQSMGASFIGIPSLSNPITHPKARPARAFLRLRATACNVLQIVPFPP